MSNDWKSLYWNRPHINMEVENDLQNLYHLCSWKAVNLVSEVKCCF